MKTKESRSYAIAQIAEITKDMEINWENSTDSTKKKTRARLRGLIDEL